MLIFWYIRTKGRIFTQSQIYIIVIYNNYKIVDVHLAAILEVNL